MPAFPACPQQIRAHAEQVVRRKKIDRSDPVIAKRLRYPATCEACRLCFAPRMGNIIFGKH
jgi:hypothetical protein